MVAMTALLDLEAALESSRSGVVAVARDDLGVLELGGADVLSYLHVVSSQHTADLRPGNATSALLLSPKGKIEFAFRLAVVEGGALLDTHAAAAHPLAERLQRFVFRYDVTVRQVAAGSGPGVTGSGAGASATAGAAGLTAVGASASAGAAGLAAVSLLGPGWGAALEPAGLPGPPEGADRATVAAGLVVHRTPLGDELTDDVLAEEAGLLGSHVHLDKGCYPGQETVARVHNLGQVQRRLAGLRFGGEELPPPGTDLTTEDGRRAGQVRSGVDHPELGPIALAYVRRIVTPGQLVLAGGVGGRVVELPFPTGSRPVQASA